MREGGDGEVEMEGTVEIGVWCLMREEEIDRARRRRREDSAMGIDG